MDDNWISRTIGAENLLVKSSFLNDSYQLYVCDLTAVFVDITKGADIIKRNVDLNPNVEVEVHRLVKLIKESLESGVIKVTFNPDEVCVETGMEVAGVTFIWNFCAKKAEPKLLKQLLMSPLLTMISQLLNRQKSLIECIHKKDKEIEDYKNNGAKVSRQYLETTEFNEETFFSSCKLDSSDMSSILESIFNGPGKELLQIVTERKRNIVQPTRKEELKSVEIVKEASDVDTNQCIVTQESLEMQRREDLEKISTSVKRKKKKLKI